MDWPHGDQNAAGIGEAMEGFPGRRCRVTTSGNCGGGDCGRRELLEAGTTRGGTCGAAGTGLGGTFGHCGYFEATASETSDLTARKKCGTFHKSVERSMERSSAPKHVAYFCRCQQRPVRTNCFSRPPSPSLAAVPASSIDRNPQESPLAGPFPALKMSHR